LIYLSFYGIIKDLEQGEKMRNRNMVIAFLAINVRLKNLDVKIINIDKDFIVIELPDGECRSMSMIEGLNLLTDLLDNDDSPENIG
jgi:hypothetical protein